MHIDDYAEILCSTIEWIRTEQRDRIFAASKIVKDVIKKDGLIYIFGCGHSGILSEETFYRAGGLACVRPVFYEPLMLHESASESSRLEKQADYFEKAFSGLGFTDADALICMSSSGVNSVPVQFADAARRKGVPVIGISSDAYLSQEPHNPLGKHLQEVCDVCIDNHVPHGDACLSPGGLPVKMTPVSSVAGAFIVNSILVEATQKALDEGLEVPVYMSGNIPGGAEYNRALIERYKARIPNL